MAAKIAWKTGPAALFVCLLGYALPCTAETNMGWKKAWIASVVTLVGAHAADFHSSQGRPEMNPLLRGSNGHFSSRKALVWKSAASGGFLLLQAILIKKSAQRNLYKPFSIATGAVAGYTLGSAIRNYSLSGTVAPTVTPSLAQAAYLLPDPGN